MSLRSTPYILIATAGPTVPALNINIQAGSEGAIPTARMIAVTLAKAGYYNFDLFVDEGDEKFFNLGRIEVAVSTNTKFIDRK